MSTEDTKDKKRPQVYFRKIIFNDGTELQLEKNSIVVFTGANNSGKSQVLKDIETCVDNSNHTRTIVTKEVEREYSGSIDQEGFLKEHFFLNRQGNYQMMASGNSFNMDSLKNNWLNQNLVNGLHGLFVHRLSTEVRLNSSDALVRTNNAENHPIYKMVKNERLAQQISDYFSQAFGVDLIVNRNEMTTIPLHIGKSPDKTAFTIDKQDDYYQIVSELPKLQEQGDGMRSFASILLNTFTSDYSVTLIDEPEAFLHPPQARVLGKMLAHNNPNSRQLFISTHSEDFLQGLLDADNNNVTVIRINREESINRMSILRNDRIRELWDNPLLRYSNILSGLFHGKVVICESDYDCLFYQALINAIYEHNNDIAPDILFTHCGGKNRIKEIVKALKAVDVPVLAITDFDLLNSSQNLKSLVNAFGMDWDGSLATDMKTIYDSMNAKMSADNDAWKQIKKVGKAGLTGDEPAAYENVERLCKDMGLFIVPVGEMECFDKTVNREKKDWVYHVLENYELANEPKLHGARVFIKEVIEF